MISKYLENFPREFIGHGIGIGAHEEPRMNHVNKTVLEPGTVYCIEYSYYHEGVRHHTEETFLLTEDGVECWTEHARAILSSRSRASALHRRMNKGIIPTVIDQNPCAHLRMPRDMIFHGWSMRLFQVTASASAHMRSRG